MSSNTDRRVVFQYRFTPGDSLRSGWFGSYIRPEDAENGAKAEVEQCYKQFGFKPKFEIAKVTTVVTREYEIVPW